MKSYKLLTQEERYYISALKASKLSLRQIGKQLNRSASSIYREIKRNSVGGRYIPERAQKKAFKRRRAVGPRIKIEGELAKKVKEGLESMHRVAENNRRTETGIFKPDQYKYNLKIFYFDKLCAQTHSLP